MKVHQGCCLEILPTLPAESVQTVITSPPYWGLRDYGHPGQLGLEPTPAEYVANMVKVFSQVRRVLKPDGTLWLNLGDSYATGAGKVGNCPGGGDNKGQRSHSGTQPNRMPQPNLKPKEMVGIPWRVALALQADGWWLRSDIIWHKPNPMPSSVTDRPTTSHEYLFLLTRAARYFYDAEAIKEPDKGRPAGNVEGFKGRQGTAEFHHQKGGVGSDGWVPGTGRNKRSVWTVPTQPFPGSHFAVMPRALVQPCIKAGSRVGDLVLDPFCGAGTVGMVARRLQRQFVGIELNPEFVKMGADRIVDDAPLFNKVKP